jgi:hypothetical protein
MVGRVNVKACNRTLDNPVLQDRLVARLQQSLLLAYLLQNVIYQCFEAGDQSCSACLHWM